MPQNDDQPIFKQMFISADDLWIPSATAEARCNVGYRADSGAYQKAAWDCRKARRQILR